MRCQKDVNTLTVMPEDEMLEFAIDLLKVILPCGE